MALKAGIHAPGRSTAHLDKMHADDVAATLHRRLSSELDDLPQTFGPVSEPAASVARRALSSEQWRTTARALYLHVLSYEPLAARLSKKKKWTFARVFRKATGLQLRWISEKQLQATAVDRTLLQELKEIAELERQRPVGPSDEAPPSPPPSPPSSPEPGLSEAPSSLQMERDAIPSAPARTRTRRVIATPRARATPYFPRDFCSSVLRAYFDPLAEPGLRRGVCYSAEARLVPFGGPVLRNVCGGVVRAETESITDTQRVFAMSVPQSGYVLCWHPTENACSLFNEDLEQLANHVFQTLDIFLPALAQSAGTGDLRDGDLHFCIMLVVQVAPVDSSTGLATIYYGPDYVREYGEPLEPARVGQPVREDVVWSMLAEHGVTGEAAVEALLLRGTPLDKETTEVASCLRRRLGVKAGITPTSVLATPQSRSPLPVIVLDAVAPQQANTYQVSDEGTVLFRVCNPSTRNVSVPALVPMARLVDPRRAQGCSASDAIVISDADSEPGDSAENPLCLSSSPPTSPPDSDFTLEVRHCCICPAGAGDGLNSRRS